MDDTSKMEGHLSSAAAFVEGGIQEACDDSCSICLEAFSDSDPSSVTGCKHEFHLQCILEWCQRSSQCPMCWQAISLKDQSSQELLEAIVQERNFNLEQSRNTAIFHHPALGEFELPLGSSEAELEERIIQHLAAAAAMGRARRMARRDGQRRIGTHHSGQGRPQLFVFSSYPSGTGAASSEHHHHHYDHDHNHNLNGVDAAAIDNSNNNRGDVAPLSSSLPNHLTGRENSPSSAASSSYHLQFAHTSPFERDVNSAFPAAAPLANEQWPSSDRNLMRQPAAAISSNEERAGPSDMQSLSESLKSRFNAVSLRCKESITKTTRGWRERFFSRNSPVASSDAASEERRAINPPGVPLAAEGLAVAQVCDRRTSEPPRQGMQVISESPADAATVTEQQRGEGTSNI